VNLTPDEDKILAELYRLAGGMAVKGELSRLNESQMDMLQTLKRKGHVATGKNTFMVILPPSDTSPTKRA